MQGPVDAAEFEKLKSRCTALESLVIDLLRLTHQLHPHQLERLLSERGTHVAIAKPRPVGPSAERKRQSIVAAAGIGGAN